MTFVMIIMTQVLFIKSIVTQAFCIQTNRKNLNVGLKITVMALQEISNWIEVLMLTFNPLVYLKRSVLKLSLIQLEDLS